MTKLLQRPLVPIASVEDAEKTRQALVPYLAEIDSLVSLHVIEKAGGAPDVASVEQREELAAEAQEVMAQLPDDIDVETRTTYGTDPVERILEEATDTEATAIAFRPRPGGRLVQFLSGDIAIKLVTNDRHPVVALPAPGE